MNFVANEHIINFKMNNVTINFKTNNFIISFKMTADEINFSKLRFQAELSDFFKEYENEWKLNKNSMNDEKLKQKLTKIICERNLMISEKKVVMNERDFVI